VSALLHVTILDVLAVQSNTVPSRLESAYVALYRATSLASRPGIVLAEEDLPAVDNISGSRSRSHDLISDLESAGRLRSVRRGAYVLVDAGGNVRVDILDLIAALSPKPHLITAGRALQFHNLTDQHFRLIVVLVTRQARPWSWRGEKIRYSRSSRTFRGAGVRTRKTRATIATPERAVADSLDHPQWGVTLAQVAEALDVMLARDRAFADRLATEVARDYGPALARRFGLLVSWLADDETARAFLPLRGRSKAAVKLVATGPDAGPVDPVWGVRENVDLSRLTQHREQ
jgi:predicted transcriptional regulator of viral defense system